MYRKIELTQGTESWLFWRSKVLTATAASIIMGLNPFAEKDAQEQGHSAIYILWAEKIGLIQKDFKVNEAMTHGTNTEDVARQAFIAATGIDMTPVCVENIEYPFMAASLDGINEEHRIGLEIKCPLYFPSFRKHKEEIPSYYKSQIYHQMLVCGYSKWAFWSYFNNSDVLHIVEKDEKFQAELLSRCILFQSLVNSKLEPPEELFQPYVY